MGCKTCEAANGRSPSQRAQRCRPPGKPVPMGVVAKSRARSVALLGIEVQATTFVALLAIIAILPVTRLMEDLIRGSLRPDKKSMHGYFMPPFSAAFSVAPALNAGTFAALICSDLPFLGLRPMRAARSRTSKMPKPDKVILSPFSSVLLITSISATTLRSASALVLPVLLANAAMSSFLFIITSCTLLHFAEFRITFGFMKRVVAQSLSRAISTKPANSGLSSLSVTSVDAIYIVAHFRILGVLAPGHAVHMPD